MWYRLAKTIIAGRKEVIQILGDENLFPTVQEITSNPKYQTTVAYFIKQGINPDQIREYVKRLSAVDERKPISIQASPKGVLLNQKSVDWIEFTEAIDGNYNAINTRQKPQSTEQPSVIDGEITVTKAENLSDACRLGANTTWCISKRDSGMFQSYRDTQASTFYIVNDGTQPEGSPLRKVAVDVHKNGISLTDLNNTTGKIHQFAEDSQAYLNYLSSRGVDISQFVNDPITKEEIEDKKIVSRKNNNLFWFKKLSFELKSKYIGMGHQLTSDQLLYLADANADDLILQYLNTGVRLSPEEKDIISKKRQWAETYVRARKIYFDNAVLNSINQHDFKEFMEFPGSQELITKDAKYAYLYSRYIAYGRFPEGEPVIAKDAKHAYYYALNVIRGRFPEGEPAIAKNSEYAYLYAEVILKRRWPEGESAIAKDSEYAYFYALNVIRGRFPEGEPAISEDAEYSYFYAKNVTGERFPEGEPAIAENGYYASEYAKYILKGRFPEGEPAIATSRYAYDYALNVIGGRFPEGESAIAKDGPDAFYYAKDILKGRFPEGEPAIAKDASFAYLYATEVLKGRFPEGEPAIAKSGYYASKYNAFLTKNNIA